MRYDQQVTTSGWGDYELLDSGDTMKLERFGSVITARPETQALWQKQKPELWETAHAEFSFHDKKGAWNMKKPVPESWELSWHDPSEMNPRSHRASARFIARLTGFKHTGVFPEQAPNWEWLAEKTSKLEKPSVLNLFGYTGIASLVAAQAGAFVTHVDASKQSLDWARENARLSNIPEDRIRWIPDDALAFVKREVRRSASYDGIILDPPAFGRGAKGEVWKIEDDFQTLLAALKEIFSNTPGSFFLVNGYAAGYAPRSFAQAVESVFSAGGGSASGGGNINGECGELHIKESSSERVIPAGIYVRFVR